MQPALVASIVLVVLATPLAAQKDVARRTFTFLDNDLTIEVSDSESGVLQVVRGGRGRVEVAARAPDGIPAFGLGGRGNNALLLTAAGADRVDYVVIVPEDVRIRVRLPGRPVAETAPRGRTSTFTWGETSGEVPSVAKVMSVPGGPHTAYYSSEVPREVMLPDPASVAQLTVRFEGTDFRVITDQPATVNAGRTDRLVLRGDAGQPLSATLLLPRTARNFTLRLGNSIAMTVRSGEVRTYCEPMVRQRIGDLPVYTFRPAGTLRCR